LYLWWEQDIITNTRRPIVYPSGKTIAHDKRYIPKEHNIKTEKLIVVLEQIIELLEKDSSTNWSKNIKSSRNKLLKSDYCGIVDLLSIYGGMNSFSDLVLGQTHINGTFEWKKDEKNSNNKLSQLRTMAYDLAIYIKHNHEVKKI